jgi:hypothetical protein
MDLNNFTEKSREALMEAQNIGTRLRHQAVDVEHLLLALLEQEGGLVRSLFEKARVEPDFLKAKVEEELGRIPRDLPATNHGNIHVRGYKEEGTITTPFDMMVLNDLDRFHLVIDTIDRVPQTGERGVYLKQQLKDKLIEHKQYIDRYGQDLPEIRNWRRAHIGDAGRGFNYARASARGFCVVDALVR